MHQYNIYIFDNVFLISLGNDLERNFYLSSSDTQTHAHTHTRTHAQLLRTIIYVQIEIFSHDILIY